MMARQNQKIGPRVIIFALFFALVGGVLLYKSFALNPNLPGDVNNDNVVNISDLSLLLSHYNQDYPQADFNSDGKVTILDLSVVLSNYNRTYTPPPPPGGGGTAQIFISPSGSDSNNCTQNQPCRSFQRAANAAATGATIEVAAGSYPGQEIRDVHKAVTFRSAAGTQPASPAGQLRFFCVTGITVDNFDSQQMYIGPGSKNVTVKNSEFGGGSWTTGNEADPVVISGDSLNGSCTTNGFTNSGITLDNIRIHDYFWRQNPGTGPHPDCLQFYGGTNGFTLKNSLIERCVESFIGAYPDFGELHNIVIQDSTFRDIDSCSGNAKGAECTYFTTQWNCHADSHTNGGQSSGPFHWIRTTWTPNVTSGQALGPRTDCPNFTVEDSTFQYGPGSSACSTWQSLWQNSLVWRNNTFTNGGGCST